MKARQSTTETRTSRRLSRTAGTSSRSASSRTSSSVSRTSNSKSRAPKPSTPLLTAPVSPFTLPNAPLAKPPRRSRAVSNSVQTYAEFAAALKDKKVQITLGNNIVTPENIVIDYDVAINLNGHCILSEQHSLGARVLDIRRGEVTITGEGKIFAMGSGGTAIRLFGAISPSIPHYTTLTIDEKVQLYAPDGNGITISANLGVAYGVTVNFSGKIIAKNGICLSPSVRGRDSHLPTVNVKSGSLIIADEEQGIGIDASGIGLWQLGASKIVAGNGLHVNSGEINLEHTQIVSRQPAILIDGDIGSDIEISVDNGVYISESEHVITGNPDAVTSLEIINGDFCSTGPGLSDELSEIASLEDGNFSNDLETYLREFTIPDFVDTPSKDNPLPESDSLSEIASLPETDSLSNPAPTTKPTMDLPAPSSAAPTPAVSKDVAPSPAPDAAILPEPKPSRPKKDSKSKTSSATKSTKPASPQKPSDTTQKTQRKAAAEREALLQNFSEALTSMKNLRAEDYSNGFDEFQLALMAAEDALADPAVSAAEIRDAADELLSAFDRLEEYDELSLTDDELDQLFYHGAILQEVTDDTEKSIVKKSQKSKAKPKITTKPAPKPSSKSPLASAATPPTQAPLEVSPELTIKPPLKAKLKPAPKIISPASPSAIPSTAVQPTPKPAPAPILAPVPTPKPAPRQKSPQPSPTVLCSAPLSLSSCLIDELSPTDHWTTGATMIDETAPFTLETRPARAKSRRKPPFSNFVKSLTVGVQAGFEAFHKTRQSVKK